MEGIHELIHAAARKPTALHVFCTFLNFPRSFSVNLKFIEAFMELIKITHNRKVFLPNLSMSQLIGREGEIKDHRES